MDQGQVGESSSFEWTAVDSGVSFDSLDLNNDAIPEIDRAEAEDPHSKLPYILKVG